MSRDQKVREYFIPRHKVYEHTLKGEFFDKISNLIAELQDFLPLTKPKAPTAKPLTPLRGQPL